MTTIQVRFGKAVRRLRTAAGYSQEGFAAKAGIDRGYYGKIERGEINLSLDKIEKIAETLQLSLSALLMEVDTQV